MKSSINAGSNLFICHLSRRQLYRLVRNCLVKFLLFIEVLEVSSAWSQLLLPLTSRNNFNCHSPRTNITIYNVQPLQRINFRFQNTPATSTNAIPMIIAPSSSRKHPHQSLLSILSTRSPKGPQKSLPLERLCSSMKRT